MTRIVEYFGADPCALGVAELLRPDILNASSRQIYEIKPRGAEASGLAQVGLYIAALANAGVVVVPGPPNAPGTAGVVPAPGGAYAFAALSSGVISYRYIPRNSREFQMLPDVELGPVVVAGAAAALVTAIVVTQPEVLSLAPGLL